ncbi:MAG TPA: tetratricopeptide repeat protein [Blastocatellia bacterium]|nr:tetratricopeptide repeat protein [Blastocatellia bacterium]
MAHQRLNRWIASRSNLNFYRYCLLAVALCLLVSSPACSKRALLDQAQAAWDSGDYGTAAKLYEDFLKDNPQSDKAATVRFRVAMICHRDLKQYDRAVQHYIHLIEDFPKSPDLYAARKHLAECYAATEKRREAISEYENILPSTTDEKEKRQIRLNIAELYYELEDLGQAVAEYQKVTANAPYDELSERAYLRISGIRYLRDELEDAVQAFQTIAQHSQDPTIRRTTRFNLADCYARMSQYEMAVKTLEETEPDPKSPEYIKQRVAEIREQQRERNLASPSSLGWPKKKG